MRQDLVGKRASPERRVSEGERYITAHRRAADPRIGALRERRATDRRVSVPAASNRAASAAKAGVGPFQRSSFTSSRGSVGIVSEYSSRLTEESHHLGDGRLIPILFGCSRVIANSRGITLPRRQKQIALQTVLLGIQIEVTSAQRIEFFVSAAFDNLSLLDHQNLICSPMVDKRCAITKVVRPCIR